MVPIIYNFIYNLDSRSQSITIAIENSYLISLSIKDINTEMDTKRIIKKRLMKNHILDDSKADILTNQIFNEVRQKLLENSEPWSIS